MAPRNRLAYPCAAIAALLIYGAVGSMDYADALMQESVYCANVRDWNASGGEFGHPDYNNNAEKICE